MTLHHLECYIDNDIQEFILRFNSVFPNVAVNVVEYIWEEIDTTMTISLLTDIRRGENTRNVREYIRNLNYIIQANI